MTSVRRPAIARLRLAAAVLPLVLAGGVLTGCGNEADNEPDSQETAVEPSDSPTDSPTDSEDGGTETDGTETVPGADSRVARRAVKDLAEREGVDASGIEVVSVEEITWSDGSIGCAKPGRAYTQATIDGQRIILRLDGKDFSYHAAGDKDASYCAKPTQ